MSAKPKLKPAVTLAHPIYDDEKKWSSAGIFNAPLFNRERYQKQIDQIFGLSADGYSICRLSWAWECRKWVNYEWDAYGTATKGEWRQRYKALTVEIGDDEYIDIAPPRWVLEERFEPGQYEQSWEGSRYVHDAVMCRRCQNRAMGLIENSTSCVRHDIWGAAPRDGWYNLVPHIGVVAEHERGMRCCSRLWKSSREICYGRYKIPDGRELQILREAVARRNADPEVNPHAVLDEQSLAQARAWGLDAKKESHVKSQQELKDMFRDEVNTHGAKLATPMELAMLKAVGAKTPINREIFT